ncbi:hypothetical protein HDU85_001538 [Gaertneriomyces sp. JEL0708]|nr:hypothetical protein HDU85_001538 [Gaertneriomyces sp. JEL0708]
MAFVAWSDDEGLTAAENDDDPDHSVPLRLRSYVEKRMKENTLDPVAYAKYLNPDLTDKDSAFLSLQAAVEWVKSRSSRLTSGAKKHATEASKRLAKYPWDDPMGPWATFWESVANKQHAKLQRLKRNLQGEIEFTSRSGLALEKTLRKVNKAKARRKRGTSPAQAVADEDEEVTTSTKKRTTALTPFLHTPMKPQLKTSTKFETAAEIVFLFRASRHDPSEAQLPYVEQMNNIYDVSCVPSSVREMMAKLSAKPIASAPGVLLSSDNQEDKHLHVARSVIFDFWAMTRHMSGNVLVPGRERKHLIEQVSPLFKHMEHTFHNIAFDWMERPANSTKSLRQMCEGKRQTFAVDVLGIAAADSSEITYVEHSGYVFERLMLLSSHRTLRGLVGGAYHYSNADGSYYYQNTNGSTYYSDPSGQGHYTAPSDNPRYNGDDE